MRAVNCNLRTVAFYRVSSQLITRKPCVTSQGDMIVTWNTEKKGQTNETTYARTAGRAPIA